MRVRCAAKIHRHDLRSGGCPTAVAAVRHHWLQLRVSVAAVAAMLGCRCVWSSSGISAMFRSIGDKHVRNQLLSLVLNGETMLLLVLLLLLSVLMLLLLQKLFVLVWCYPYSYSYSNSYCDCCCYCYCYCHSCYYPYSY